MKAPPIPDVVVLGPGLSVRVVRVSMPPDLYGTYCHARHEIEVSDRAEGWDAVTILRHEIYHVAEAVLQDQGEISHGDGDRHAFIYGLAELMTKFAMLNPGLLG